jgi:hypothetical protein
MLQIMLHLEKHPVAGPGRIVAEGYAGTSTPEIVASAGVTRGSRNPAPLVTLLSAAYDRAALAIDQGVTPGPLRAALERLVRGVVP